jgi:RimJ/RimL family protein N-acetyltransferase
MGLAGAWALVTVIEPILGSADNASVETLHTTRLVLEPLVEAHADALYPLLCEPRQLEYLDQGPPESLDALRRGYRKLESRRSPDGTQRWLNWAIVVSDESANPVGFVQATVLADHRAWVAYEVGLPWWGRGIATEATQAMRATPGRQLRRLALHGRCRSPQRALVPRARTARLRACR